PAGALLPEDRRRAARQRDFREIRRGQEESTTVASGRAAVVTWIRCAPSRAGVRRRPAHEGTHRTQGRLLLGGFLLVSAPNQTSFINTPLGQSHRANERRTRCC